MVKIAIIDDHSIVRQGIIRLLEDNSNFSVIHQDSSVESFCKSMENKSVDLDVLILDIALPGISGFAAIEKLLKKRPDLKIIMLSALSEEAYAIQCVKEGARGFVSKEAVDEELVFAIKRVVNNDIYFSSELTRKIAMEIITPTTQDPHKQLTKREFQVMCGLGAGSSLNDIADRLNISHKTVSTYRYRLMQKMNMKTTNDLIKYCISKGITSSNWTEI
jgi:DNA-binding NarL/FixJ family response regulator